MRERESTTAVLQSLAFLWQLHSLFDKLTLELPILVQKLTFRET